MAFLIKVTVNMTHTVPELGEIFVAKAMIGEADALEDCAGFLYIFSFFRVLLKPGFPKEAWIFLGGVRHPILKIIIGNEVIYREVNVLFHGSWV